METKGLIMTGIGINYLYVANMINKVIDEVAANSPNSKIVAFGTEETINQIKSYIPSHMSVRIVPAEMLPENSEDLLYIVPIDNIKSLD